MSTFGTNMLSKEGWLVEKHHSMYTERCIYTCK